MNYIKKINESVAYINNKISKSPTIGVILGSGLGGLVKLIQDPITIPYEDIPNFPLSTVEGHAGHLVIGKLGDKTVVTMQGRFHFYEGYPLSKVTFPIRTLISLGIQKLIVTNAAGGVNESFVPGDLMIINDHINFSGTNPLIGPNLESKGPRFLDMTEAYSKELIELAQNVGKNLDINLKEGVYMWFTGPSYETPSEIKLASTLGADAVGMSTVPEVIIANHESLDVLGISCITNMAAGILDKPLNHEEVVETSLKVKDKFERLVIEIIRLM
ncbi:MAG TPA: purine-nucleoside phosphorylase [Tissierellaceae bacterium]|nr:purine-nucleoside phosphorylase [Tissierellaceae bacterium]